jgi:hypothetical protein
MYIFEDEYRNYYSDITQNIKNIYIHNSCKYLLFFTKLFICLLIYYNNYTDSHKYENNIILNFSRYLLKLCYINELVTGIDYYMLTNNNTYLPKYLNQYTNSANIPQLLYKLNINNYNIFCNYFNDIVFSIKDTVKYVYEPLKKHNNCYINIDNILFIINYVMELEKIKDICTIFLILNIIKIALSNSNNNIISKINVILKKISIDIKKCIVNMDDVVYIFKNNYIEIINFLLRNQIKIDYYYKDNYGNTLLHYMCINKNYDIIRQIFKYSNIYSHNNNNISPSNFAKNNEYIRKIFDINYVCNFSEKYINMDTNSEYINKIYY